MTLFERIWLLLSQALNALRYAGDPDESLSARAWRLREQPEWGRRRLRIDAFFRRWRKQDDHCRQVHEQQIKRENARKGSSWQS